MEINFGEFIYSDDKRLLQIDRTCDLIWKTYWANQRSRDVIIKSLEHSICIGIYHRGVMMGFARIITDYATMYYICDVIIDEEFRGRGLGKKLVEVIVNLRELNGLSGILVTTDAHKLYEKYGFENAPVNKFMRRQAN